MQSSSRLGMPIPLLRLKATSDKTQEQKRSEISIQAEWRIHLFNLLTPMVVSLFFLEQNFIHVSIHIIIVVAYLLMLLSFCYACLASVIWSGINLLVWLCCDNYYAVLNLVLLYSYLDSFNFKRGLTNQFMNQTSSSLF